jgi:hypothetical protein
MSLNAVWEGELMGMILPGVPSVLLMGFFPELTSQWLYGPFSDISFFCRSQILILPKLSDLVESHRVPMGSAGRMGRRNFSQAVSTAATTAG